MIDDISKYRYVTGDLNTIIIDGSIMPRRNNNDKKLLRGEDITFCIEILRRRLTYPCTSGKCVCGSVQKWTIPEYSGQDTFTNKVTSQPYQLIVRSALQDCAFNPQYYMTYFGGRFMTNCLSELPTATKFYSEHQGSNPFNYESFFLNQTFSFLGADSQSSSPNDFASGKPLKQANVQKIFDDIETIDKLEFQLPASDLYFGNNELELTNLVKWFQPTESGWEPDWPTHPQYLGYFMRGYKHKNIFSDYYYSWYGTVINDIEVELDTETMTSSSSLWAMMFVNTAFHDPDSGNQAKEYVILKQVDDNPTLSSGKLKFKFKMDKSMIDDIASDIGVQLKPAHIPEGEYESAVTVQQTFDVDIISMFVVGEVSENVKW